MSSRQTFAFALEKQNNEIFTSRDEQEESSSGNTSIEFLERSTFVISLDSHTSAGTAVKLSPPKESSWEV